IASAERLVQAAASGQRGRNFSNPRQKNAPGCSCLCAFLRLCLVTVGAGGPSQRLQELQLIRPASAANQNGLLNSRNGRPLRDVQTPLLRLEPQSHHSARSCIQSPPQPAFSRRYSPRLPVWPGVLFLEPDQCPNQER